MPKFRLLLLTLGMSPCLGIAIGEEPTRSAINKHPSHVYIEEGRLEKSVLYADGREVEVPTQTLWRPICGSDLTRITEEELRRVAGIARQAELAHPIPQGGVASTTAGFDLVFNIISALPPGAAEALASVEQYIEAQFSDPITVVVNFGFTSLPPAILGQTGSNFTTATWTNARNGLTSGMDSDDTIQLSLPMGSTIPVRYSGVSATVTNEDRAFVTVANYRAGIGTIFGSAATIEMNTNFSWDYTPPNISGGAYCFQSVVAHEVGHSLGFVSGTDSFASDIYLLDIYRFQNSDGTGTDHNPDSLAEFQTTARLVDVNSPLPNDDVNSDLITAEFRMSDGNPSQASHFTAQNPGIYVMDPSLSATETFYPDFFRVGDSAMFDAIGWDFPPENTSCEQAIPLKCGSIDSFDTSTNVQAPSPSYSCGSGSAHQGTMWFSFVASSASTQISTCGSDGTDTTLAVYSGDCGELVEVGCAEDGGCSTKPGLSVICLNGLLIGETYHVQVSSRTPADQRTYLIQLDCECPGACCLPPPTGCAATTEPDCAILGGDFAGPGTQCLGDLNEDDLDDACEQDHVEFSQLPTPEAEDSPSNLDPGDMNPAVAVTDDFTSDGRPIHTVRWWGSAINPSDIPTGWMIGFYEPLVEAGPPAAALGIYFCDATVVTAVGTPIDACDPHAVVEYEARLFDCCLIQSTADSRSGEVPAQRESFQQELCVEYDLGIHSVIRRTYTRDTITGDCIPLAAGVGAAANFWGWHRTAHEQGVRPALSGPITVSGADFLVGPMSLLGTTCGPTNAAFELITTTPAGQSHPAVWDNGDPNGVDIFGSQSGGEETDWMTIDDFEFPEGGTLEEFSFTIEEESPYAWSGRVRVEIYPDSGSLSPDESGGPTAAYWVPDDAGAVGRVALGPGAFYDRARYEVSGLSLVLPPGRWWLGAAAEGTIGGTGRTFWNSSHSVPTGTTLFGGEAHIRAASESIPSFTPWSTFLSGRQSDVSFVITRAVEVDCNCNGVEDPTDILLATSLDCNANQIPDECEYDCDANGIPDQCDIADLTATDCQGNGVIDACELLLGHAIDLNNNDLPDECCEVPVAPTELFTPVPRNRALSINPGHPGQRTALRVRLVNLQDPNPPNPPSSPPRDFSAFENTYRWVGPPQSFPEFSSPMPTFFGAPLQCEPFFMDWSSIETLHVFGPEVMPSSQYEIQAIEETCFYFGDPSAFSPVLAMSTARWGDVMAAFQPPSEAAQPDALDVVAIVNKFRGLATGPIKASAMLQPAILDFNSSISALDIVSCVDAFRGVAYPYQGVVVCPP